MAASSVRLPLRGSIPPTARTTGRSSQPSRARASSRAGAAANRAASTPFGITSAGTPKSRATTSAQWRLTQMRWSTSAMEARWHSASTGLRKSSTWWIVRTTAGTAPSARSASSERAERQSSAWCTSAGPAARRPSARVAA